VVPTALSEAYQPCLPKHVPAPFLLAPLLVQPPLAGLASTWEVLSICLGATHQGMHFGASAGSSACALGSGSGSGSIELCFWASVALRSQQSRQQLQEAIGAPAGHAVAAPAAAWEGVGGTGAAIQQQQQQQEAEAVYVTQPVLGQPPSLGAPALGTDAALQPWQQEALGTPPLQHLDPLAGAGVAGVASVASGSACGRATILDSPSEMLERPCRFPSGTTSGHADTLADAWQQQQQQQQQGPQLSSGSAAADPGSSSSASDFMHPEHWLAARQADGHLVVEAGSEASSHSFLLPGRAYSDASSNDGGEEEEEGSEPLNALSPAAARLLPPGLTGHDTVPPLPPTLPSTQEQQWLPIGQLEPHELTAAAPPAPAPVAAAVVGGGVGGGELAPPPLPLYGRGDHAVQHDLTLAERLQLAVRAAQLLALFAPFLLLGSAMLLLAARLDARAERRKQVVGLVPVAEEPVPLGGVVALEAGASATGERLRTKAFKLLLKACRRRCARCPFCCPCCSAARAARSVLADPRCGLQPALLPAPCLLLSLLPRLMPLPPRFLPHLLPLPLLPPSPPSCPSLPRSGPAFIKWGQWAATREDIFPPSFCSVLSELHDKAPTHPLAQVGREGPSPARQAVEGAALLSLSGV
jgi:aarF domain-containing kinase